nr:hypothetical protein [Rhodococcus sp. DMU2021]
MKLTNPRVALHTEKLTDHTSLMVMVDKKLPGGTTGMLRCFRLPADGTHTILLNHHAVVFADFHPEPGPSHSVLVRLLVGLIPFFPQLLMTIEAFVPPESGFFVSYLELVKILWNFAHSTSARAIRIVVLMPAADLRSIRLPSPVYFPLT